MWGRGGERMDGREQFEKIERVAVALKLARAKFVGDICTCCDCVCVCVCGVCGVCGMDGWVEWRVGLCGGGRDIQPVWTASRAAVKIDSPSAIAKNQRQDAPKIPQIAQIRGKSTFHQK